MTDLLPAPPAWQSWHSQYLQSERLSGSRHNYTSISGNQARYGHSEIHCCSILRTNSTWFTFSISPVFPFPRIWCIQSVSRIHSQPQQPLRAVQQNLKMLMSLSHLLLTFLYIFLCRTYEFQFSICSVFCTKKNKKTAFCTPCYVQVPVVHILVGPINLPQSSSLQSPDPRSSSSLQPLLISQPTKLFIHYWHSVTREIIFLFKQN